ncbi:ATP-binding protein [Aliiroseovarius sp. KMU-50]|uniref:histidine kinase n=1 Tax=Aliiroseovarius salicola TaxID=3009082 RepID=A0ABT4W5N6_9RHOB|nr:ATP-binding protein [Aliiroseovarius sp. KMU-50]MDA5095820.1 ATP-binding protein [Aliiroseovarius sp. KMU-50]
MSQVADGSALNDIVEFLEQGVAVFDAEANLSLANSTFCAMYPALSDILRPGTPWSIFLREAVNRGAMPLLTSQQLELMEANFDGAQGTTDIVEMPSSQGRSAVLRFGPLSDGGFVLTQSIRMDEASGNDAAREAELLLRKVLEACPASLTMSRVADGQVIYRSPAATELLGTAKSSFAHFAQVEERADFVTLLLPDAKVDNLRVTCLRPDGEAFPAVISARLIDYRGEDVIVASIEDLTTELAVQDELDRQKERLFQSEKLSALGELLAGIAHELNNPLSIIVGNTDILQEELESSPHEQRIDKISQAAYRCVRIIRSFLSLARQERLDLQPLDPARIIRAAADAVSVDLKAAKVQLQHGCSQSYPEILADEVQLTQVLINLLTNAIHAIQETGTGNQIDLNCTQKRKMFILRITDNGPGVDEAIKKRIFDPLFTTKDAGKGTGVGLAFCQRILLAHKGQIRLESAGLGNGASFVLEVPLAHP